MGDSRPVRDGGERLDRTRPLAAARLTLRRLVGGLLSDGLLSRDKVRVVLSQLEGQTLAWPGDGAHPMEALAELRLEAEREPGQILDEAYLAQWVAARAGLSFCRIDPLELDPGTATRAVSQAYAKRHGILPLILEADRVVFASAEPAKQTWESELNRILGKTIERVFCMPSEIRRYQDEFYSVGRSVREASDQHGPVVSNALLNLEQLVDLGSSVESDAENGHVIRIVDWLLQFAFEQRASDIHLEPRRETGRVRFRIDGTLHLVYEFPPSVMTAVTSRIKVLGRMDLAERRRPQDGRIKTRTAEGLEIELRLSTMPTAFGEKCVMRIFDPKLVGQGFAELGLADEELATWLRLVDRPNGIVLLTGPTGSGKTTTLYATLEYLAGPEINVCSIEDPIEMVAEHLNQLQVHKAIGLDFAAGIRTLLRQDPDVVMVGEIRDEETAKMAIQASLTGHLVLSTLHTNDAPSAITRLLDIGAPHYLVQSTLAGIAAQRLVRTLCRECKGEAAPDPNLWQALVAPWKVAMPERIGSPRGCSECRNTGFRGRRALFEIMEVTQPLAQLIRADCDVQELRKQGIRDGMRTLRTSAISLVASGQTTIEEVARVLSPGAL